MFKVFETPCDEIRINKLYLNGSCIHPHNLKKLNWVNIFQSQHIETLYLRKMIYVESYFESLSKLWSCSLIVLELTLSFSVDDNKSTPKSVVSFTFTFKRKSYNQLLPNVSLINQVINR